MHRLSLARTPVERAEEVSRMAELSRLAKRRFLTMKHPGASENEINAIWLESAYRGKVDDSLMDKALAVIRSRDQAK